MKLINIAVLLSIGLSSWAQDIHFDYDRSVNFASYRTYQWVDYRPVPVSDELLDWDIKRAVDEQLATKGLRRVDSGADLLVGYQAGISQEKEFDNLGAAWGPWYGRGGRVTTATIDIGKLVVGIFDVASRQLVWQGFASKTLDLSKDPDKNYRTLERAMAKLFAHYPPGIGRK